MKLHMNHDQKSLSEQMEELQEAWLDLMYELTKPIQRFAENMNLELKPWVSERKLREEKENELKHNTSD